MPADALVGRVREGHSGWSPSELLRLAETQERWCHGVGRHLRWLAPRLDVDWDGVPTQLADLHLQVGWRSEDLTEAWATMGGAMETTALDLAVYPPESGDTGASGSVCLLLHKLGVPACGACGEAEECMHMVVHAMSMFEVTDLAPSDELPACGIDRSTLEVQSVSCNPQAIPVDCGCDSTGAAWLPLWAVGLAALARRRRGSRGAGS